MPHALVLVHDHPQRDTWNQQQAFFQERILPNITSAPGFVSGNWSYDEKASRTHSFVVFDTEANAKGMYEFVRGEGSKPNPFGVTLISATLTSHLYSR